MKANRFFHADLVQHVGFLSYRYRFLFVYVVIGFCSLLLEIAIFHQLERMGLFIPLAGGIGLAAGILFAYWMNVRFNFKVPTAKRNRALLYFCSISAISAAFNFAFNEQLQRMGWGYEQARLVVAGSLFLVAYSFHRKYSFSDYKKVGVAIYANGIEDIRGIHERIGQFADFIHIDILDETFRDACSPPATYRLEAVQAYWPRKPIHVHIMSRTPRRWIEHLRDYARTVIIHTDLEEPVQDVLASIREAGMQAGICLTINDTLERLRRDIAGADLVMLLAIAEPGHSGQPFDSRCLDMIREINRWPERRDFMLLVDGGVNEQNIGLLNVEGVVSGSSVLNSTDPARQIMRLQTSGNYERI